MLGKIFIQNWKNQFKIKWIWIAVLIGLLSGSASAFFLLLLEWAKKTREANHWLLFLLPVGGFFVAVGYKYWGKSIERGNNLIVEEIQKPSKVISFLMAPLVLIGTVTTHVFGGSAGREGTAIQMGASIADQLNFLTKFSNEDRKILLMCGMAAGFSSLFGTPLAGAAFALEIIFIGKFLFSGLLPVLLSSFFAFYVCDFWPVEHTRYTIGDLPELNIINIGWIFLASIVFGTVSRIFSTAMFWFTNKFKKYISSVLIRPLVGGTIVSMLIYLFGFKYAGLGLDTIVDSFFIQQGWEVFALKLVLTVITLSAGFRGGEVTPLFFIGASLGSALSLFIPLPIGLLAGVGFVAVFSGATNSPIACALMGLELFMRTDFDSALTVFILIGCFVSYYISGHTGIYSSQIIARPKYNLFKKRKGKMLSELMK